MNTSLAKNFEFKDLISDFAGYNSARDKTNVAPNVMTRGSQNIYKKINGNLAVRDGQARRGDANSTLSACSSEFVWNTSWGATYTLVIANSNLYVVIDDVWYSLLSGLTKTRYVFDSWWDNTEKKDRVLFVNGTDDMFHWSGGYTTVLSSTLNTITKSGSTSWQQAGFSTTSGEKTIVIGGTTFTYTGGESTTTLTGVTPDASGITVGATALQAVQTETNTPASGFLSDFIKVINNQVYVGSYTSRLCYISKSTDFTDYVVPTPREPGDPELLTLDGVLKGIGVRQGKAHIGIGSSAWATVSFNDITVGTTLTQQTTVDVKPVAVQQAPYAHEFIDNVGDNLVYLGQDQILRVFGDFNNLFVAGYPSISDEVETELQAEDFTNGGLRAIGEFIYITAPNSGKVYLRQERTTVDYNGNIVAERLWHSPFIWNLTRVDDFNGEVIGFSNANPQIYDLWDTEQWYDDSPSDEELPYECILALGYRSNNRRQGLQYFDKMFTEGYMAQGTTLNYEINYDYQGSTSTVSGAINSDSQPTTFFGGSDPASLGDSSIGDESLGDSESSGDSADNLPKFKNITSLALVNCFEYQPILQSNSANARWEILALGTNAVKVDTQNADFIVNKLQT
jgi:hypothetical protein